MLINRGVFAYRWGKLLGIQGFMLIFGAKRGVFLRIDTGKLLGIDQYTHSDTTLNTLFLTPGGGVFAYFKCISFGKTVHSFLEGEVFAYRCGEFLCIDRGSFCVSI
jgi:hypothetical protein